MMESLMMWMNVPIHQHMKSYNIKEHQAMEKNNRPLLTRLVVALLKKNQDEDGIFDDIDNCIETPNPDQADKDGDGIG